MLHLLPNKQQQRQRWQQNSHLICFGSLYQNFILMWFVSIFYPISIHKTFNSQTYYLIQTQTRKRNETIHLFTLFSYFLFGKILFGGKSLFFWQIDFSAPKCPVSLLTCSESNKNCLKANKFFNTLPIFFCFFSFVGINVNKPMVLAAGQLCKKSVPYKLFLFPSTVTKV